ncbi:MAG: aminotransferase class I/II-fold pyridoxal phosphate-dependent enzyme [Bacteroidales bacterium]|nr:aminotransferase class I/II-fold pyridoxal phosphate-dependent enzyme [Bacteroidales bacterium]
MNNVMLEAPVSTFEDVNKLTLQDVFIKNRKLKLNERMNSLYEFVEQNKKVNHTQYFRQILSPADTEVFVLDEYTNETRRLTMFGSNNYMGLANHPLVKQRVTEAIKKYGVGIAGPPHFNGYSKLHAQLEERLSHLKGKESTLLFGSGYSANIGVVNGLVNPKRDAVFYDENCHASFYDSLRLARVNNKAFKHNNMAHLADLFETEFTDADTKFIGIEGIYSMEGDAAPLPEIIKIAKKHNALTILDDAHGTLVMGKNGGGTTEHFGLEKETDIVVGTFSKSFAITGGFISASKEIVNYIKYFSKIYMFSTSLPFTSVAAVLAALEVMEKEPERLEQLHANIKYLTQALRRYGLVTEPQGAVIALKVPEDSNMRKVSNMFHEMGLFVNSIEFPAVPKSNQRIRISVMATHTKPQMDRLIEAVGKIWAMYNC